MTTSQKPEPVTLMPHAWREGDKIPHPDLGVTEGGWVTITAYRANNKAQNRFRVAWVDRNGQTGSTLVENRTGWMVVRP